MRKKIFIVLLALVSAIACVFGIAGCNKKPDSNGGNSGNGGGNAAQKELQLIFSLNEDGESYSVYDTINNEGSKAVIPSTYENKPVTHIDSRAFAYCEELQSITIPNSIISIGSGAFDWCSSLTSINIPDSVTSIGSEAFLNCYALKNLTIGKGVTSIGFNAFVSCEFESITVSDGNTVYHSDGNCLIETENKKLIVGSKNSVIPTDGSVTSIDGDAFNDNRAIVSITIPDVITNIEAGAFYQCYALTIYCEAVEKPDGWAYNWNEICPVVWNCKNNDKDKDGYIYIVTDGVRYSLKEGIATVVKQPIDIVSVSMRSKVTYQNEEYTVTSIADEAFWSCQKLTSVKIPDGVTSIGKYAFNNCIAMTSITIPDSVSSIGEKALIDCGALEKIEVSSRNTVYRSDGNCLIETGSKTLIAGCKNSVIPTDGSVTSIGNFAFYHSRKLTSITIPNNITSIGESAFIGCNMLASLEIPNSVRRIDKCAFQACVNLSSITIPKSVEILGKYEFYNCPRLIIYCEAKSEPSGWDSSWQDVDRPVIWDYKNNDKDTEGRVFTVLNGVCYWLKDGEAIIIEQPITLSGKVVIPNKLTYKGTDYTVTEIIRSAFEGCSEIKSITIPDSVINIGYNAFDGCSGIIKTENGVNYVDKWVVGCDVSATEVKLRGNTKGIVESAFSYRPLLTSITIPNGVTSIGSSAFRGCRGLKSISIPDSVTNMGYSAFSGCSGLEIIYCEAAEQPSGWGKNWNDSNQLVVWGYKGNADQ